MMKYSARIKNRELERLVSLLRSRPGSGEKPNKRLRTLSKSAIITYLWLQFCETSKNLPLPRNFLDENDCSYLSKFVKIIYFYPDDLRRDLGISDDTLRRVLEMLAENRFIHLFTSVHDENNYTIYRVGIDDVSNPDAPEGKDGYTIIDRDFFEAVKKIGNVGVLRVVLRTFQENARRNDGRDSFVDKSVKSMLSGLPKYTTRPGFLKKVSEFFKDPEGMNQEPLSGILFEPKRRKRYDIRMSGEYSFQRRKADSARNLQSFMEDLDRFGHLASLLSDLVTSYSTVSDAVFEKLRDVRELYSRVLGCGLSADELRTKYSAANPYVYGAFSAFRRLLDPSADKRVNRNEFRTVAGEFGAEQCLQALRRIWTDMVTGTLGSLSTDTAPEHLKRPSFGALVRSYIRGEWVFPEAMFMNDLKILGHEERVFKIPQMPSFLD